MNGSIRKNETGSPMGDNYYFLLEISLSFLPFMPFDNFLFDVVDGFLLKSSSTLDFFSPKSLRNRFGGASQAFPPSSGQIFVKKW